MSHVNDGVTALDLSLDLGTDLPRIHVQILQHLGSDTTTFLDESKKDVLGADEIVTESLRLFSSQRHHFSCSVGETIEHLVTSLNLMLKSVIQTGPTASDGKSSARPLHEVDVSAV